MGSPTANKNFNTIYINYKEGANVTCKPLELKQIIQK